MLIEGKGNRVSGTQRSSAVRRSAILAGLLATAAASPVMAQSVVNPGFETGNTNGWTATGGYWSSGWPVPEAQYQGPPTLVSIMNTGSFDAITGAPTVFAGNHSVRLNNSSGGNDISAITQSVTNYNGNKLYYAWNAVLEPSHGANDSPSFLIKVVDNTTNTVVTNIAYSAFSAQNSTIFRTAGSFVTTDWKVEDVNVISGNNYTLTFVAVDCLYGGHGGYVYLDGFGNTIPVPNSGVTFNSATDVVQGATFLLAIGGGPVIPDIDLALPFYTTTTLAAGGVNPNFIGGTLRVDSAGPITNAFTVQSAGGTIDTNGNNVLFSGAFTGAGGLTKIGLGKLTLTGVNTINGSLAINAGTLNITGMTSPLDVQINNGGTLSGTGNVVAPVFVNAGGTLAPGDAIGALNVTGNVLMRAGSRLALDIDGRNYAAAGGAGSYDRLVINAGGTFTASGAIAPNLRGIAAPANNTFTPILGDRFTVVTASAINGAFTSVTQPTTGLSANTRFDVLYNTNNVQLVLTPASLATLGLASAWRLNAVRAGAGLDAVRPAAGNRIGPLQSLWNGLYGMDANGYRDALQQLSGEIHVHDMAVVGDTAHTTSTTALDAAASGLGADDCDSDADRKRGGAQDDTGCAQRGWRPAVWTRLLFDHTAMDDDGTAIGFENRQRGFIAGVHVLNNGTTRVGIGGRYTESDLTSTIHSTAEVNGYGLFGYASHDFGRLTLSAVGGWSQSNAKTKRTQTLLTGTSISTAAYDISAFNAGLEAKYSIPLGKGVIQPVIGVTHEAVTSNGVAETNADPNLALALPKSKWNLTRSKLGVELAMPLGGPLTFNAGGAWRHALDGNPTATRLATLGPASWTVSSVIRKDDTYEFGAGIAANLGAGTKLRVDYTGIRDGGAFKIDRAMLGLSHAF